MWVVLALYLALWTAIAFIITKRIVASVEPAIFVFLSEIFVFPFILALIWFGGGVSGINPEFFKLMVAASLLDLVGFLASTWALKFSDVSLLAPIASFNPIFTFIFGFFVLHEQSTPVTILGVFTIVVGSYLLNIHDIKRGIFVPILDLFKNRGVLLTFLTSVVFGITPVLQKPAIAIVHTRSGWSAPLLVAFAGSFLVTLYLLPYSIKNHHKTTLAFKKYWLVFLVMAPFTALSQAAGFTTFTLTHVSYATAIFKLSVLFSIVLGALFFKEKNIKERFIGASVMIVGTLLLVL